MFYPNLPDFPFPITNYSPNVVVYLHKQGVCVYQHDRGYCFISDDELHDATDGNWGIIPDGLRLEWNVSVEFLYIMGRGI